MWTESQDLEQKQDKKLLGGADFTISMPEQEIIELGRTLGRALDRWEAARAPRMGNLVEWRKDVELVQSSTSGPWPNSSAVRAPFAAMGVANHQTQLNNTITNADPPFTAIAKTRAAMEAAPEVEDALIARLDECGWRRIARDVHHEMAITGNAMVSVTWEIETSQVPYAEVNMQVEEVAEPLLDAGVLLSEALEASIEKDARGRPKWAIKHRQRVDYDGIKLRVINYEDMLLGPVTARCKEDLWLLGERVWIREADLKKGAKQGRYFPEVVEEILERGSSGSLPVDRQDALDDHGLQGELWDSRKQNERAYNTRECYELCLLHDYDGDGYEEWGVITWDRETEKILRLQWLPYQHAKPHFVPFRYLPRVNEITGMGVPEKISVLQDAATTALNQFFDLVDLMVAGQANFWYDDQAGMNLDRTPFQPGKPMRVESVQGVMQMTFVQGIPAALRVLIEILQLLKDWTDLLTATSNPALGRETDSNKTLGEVQLVLGQGQQIFGELSQGVALIWAEVWDQARWLLAQYSDNGIVEYRRAAAGKQLNVSPLPGEPPPGTDPIGDPQTPDPALGGAPPPDPVNPAGVNPEAQTMGMQPQVQPGIPGIMPDQAGGYEFLQIPAQLLTAEIDLVPAGLNYFPDANTRITQATVVQNTMLAHPLTSGNLEVLAEVLDSYLQAVRWQGREAIMEKVRAALPQLMMVQQLQTALGAAQGVQGVEQGQEQGRFQAQQNQQTLQKGAMENQMGMVKGMQEVEQGDQELKNGRNRPPARKK